MSTFPPSLSLVFLSSHLFCYFLLTCCTFCFATVFVSWVLVSDSPPPGNWQHVLDIININILQHHHHGCHDVIVSVETQLGIRVRFTLSHNRISTCPIRLPGSIPWIISCILLVCFTITNFVLWCWWQIKQFEMPAGNMYGKKNPTAARGDEAPDWLYDVRLIGQTTRIVSERLPSHMRWRRAFSVRLNSLTNLFCNTQVDMGFITP